MIVDRGPPTICIHERLKYQSLGFAGSEQQLVVRLGPGPTGHPTVLVSSQLGDSLSARWAMNMTSEEGKLHTASAGVYVRVVCAFVLIDDVASRLCMVVNAATHVGKTDREREGGKKGKRDRQNDTREYHREEGRMR